MSQYCMKIRMLCSLIFVLAMGVDAHGQDGKDTGKEEKVPVFNYVIDDPMDKFQPKNDTETITFYTPEFYFHRAHEHGDTTFQFFCYDRRDSMIRHVSNYDSVYYYSLYRNYPDPGHTYKDKDGVDKQLIVSQIIRRFDRLDSNKWREVNYLNNKYFEYTAKRNRITTRDSVVLYDPGSGKVVKHLYLGYRVVR